MSPGPRLLPGRGRGLADGQELVPGLAAAGRPVAKAPPRHRGALLRNPGDPDPAGSARAGDRPESPQGQGTGR